MNQLKLRKPKLHPLARLLKEKGITIMDAAVHLGTSHGHLSGVVRGKAKASAELKEKIDELATQLRKEACNERPI